MATDSGDSAPPGVEFVKSKYKGNLASHKKVTDYSDMNLQVEFDEEKRVTDGVIGPMLQPKLFTSMKYLRL